MPLSHKEMLVLVANISLLMDLPCQITTTYWAVSEQCKGEINYHS